MALTPTTVLDNSMTPGIAAEVFKPDQLIAGPYPIVSEQITVLSGQGVIARGTVLGKVTASGKYILSKSNAADGSQVPSAIAADTIDATSADALGGVYFTGEFNSAALTYDVATFTTLAALQAAARPQGIFVKSLAADLSMADPT